MGCTFTTVSVARPAPTWRIVASIAFALAGSRFRIRWRCLTRHVDMEKCAWVRPQLVVRIEFLEWTESNHLRHAKFAGLREDKDARTVNKEHGGEG